jgi:Fic family protein
MSDAWWPATRPGPARRWTPAGRVPRRDRQVTYRPTLVPSIAPQPLELASDTLTIIEQATLELRSADERGATGPAAAPLLRTESSASSKIEQIHIGQRHIGRALAGLPARQRAATEVASNVATIRAAVDAAKSPITSETFHQLHVTLLPDESWAGMARTEQNWIGGSDYSPREARYVPPEPNEVGRLLEDLAAFARRDDLPALAQAAIAHAQFETIHPYPDGNGRVGRALIHLVLRRRAVTLHGIAPVSVALLAHRDRYFDELSAYEHGNVERFVRMFAGSCSVAAELTALLADELAAIHEEWVRLPEIARARSHATVRKVVDALIEHPLLTAGQAAVRHEVSHEAARRALERLVDVGVLNRTTAARNLHVYEAVEVLDALERLEQQAVALTTGAPPN